MRWRYNGGGSATQAVADRGRHILGRRQNRGVVLLYHRIAASDEDPWKMCVAPETFGGHLDLLSAEFNPMPLTELLQGLGRDCLPPRAVAITFDDGYRDNLTLALPELARRQMPASVFVTTGYVSGRCRYWWDELVPLVLHGAPDRAEVALSLGGRDVSWRVTGRAARLEALQGIKQELRLGPVHQIAPTLERLRDWAGTDGAAPDGGDDLNSYSMDEDSLLELAASGFIEVGAHSRSHAGLSAQTTDVARAEIEGSRRDLAEWLGEPPAVFAYPFGDSSTSTRQLAASAGFTYGMAVLPRYPVTSRSDLYGVPRTLGVEEDPAALERRLDALLN